MTKPSDKPKVRQEVQVLTLKAEPNEGRNATYARSALHPTVQAGITTLSYSHSLTSSGDGELNLDALIAELRLQCDKVNEGDLQRAEAMLMAQAHTLDAIFGNCARRAALNMGTYLNTAETYLRLALKAQSQCRTTLETLANIKNPPTVFARQANIAHGPQQVNNGVPAPASRAANSGNLQTELSGDGNELLPDGRASQAAGRVDPGVETLGEIDRAKVDSG